MRFFRMMIVAVLTLSAPVAHAETYPAKPIRLVVGYSPGGGNDVMARIVAAKLQDRLGQPVVVENKAGAQSIIAAEFVAKAPPDGYTLLVAPSGPMTINPAIYSKLPYAPRDDFAPVSLIAEFPLLLAVTASLPVKSVAELIAHAKTRPNEANYASSAAPFQLAAELFNQKTGSKFVHVPFKGSGDAVAAVATGTVIMTISDAGPISAGLQGGAIRALAVTSATRHPAFAGVPTMAEAGIVDMVITLWTGIVAPAGTPAPIIKRLQQEIAEVMRLPDVRERYASLGIDAVSSTPEAYARRIADDIARWTAIAKAADIKLN
ncbi:tripartite tricarboxylate transporter substrate binding protein [Reyranella sp. CPCC 100927]|uniref:Bug family tripartite tricarboxylate transporter substrate binding protein n=1 Tax=Reyranella sp. CPCC 100927 TaxID=2599616 RepID=UPI0011B709A3|nr:tripartite tricarboxylate transporter substrate binding protein [Reyranella sp. CPCC 100927]TWT13643.1 tripartite tricarboxylate transporter substrate binding protein [Reyranella sp. CPCC 100927]